MINIVIPMAGRGSRFDGSVHTVPKPFIEVFPGVRMVELVMHYTEPSSLHRFIFICREEHAKAFHLKALFLSHKNSVVVTTDTITEGPACSVLLAEKYFDSEDELLIAYCDDYLNINIDNFLQINRMRNSDGGMLLYPSQNPRDSYAVTDASGRVLETAEKKIISPFGTAGLYYFKHGNEFARYAKQMIAKDRRSDGEFYVCPVFNELIEAGKLVTAQKISSNFNLAMGTPTELDVFIRLAPTSPVHPQPLPVARRRMARSQTP
jgi:NDP-sugar pyrophosphorylase family protein